MAFGYASSADVHPKVPFSVQLPANWTPVQADAGIMAKRWKQIGISQAQAQETIIQAARHHGLFAVANDSREHSPTGLVTSFALDCAKGSGKSATDQLANWRQLLKSSKTSGAQTGATSLNGNPAAWMSYAVPGGQPSLHRISEYVQGHAMSCFAALTTDQLSRYNDDFSRIISTLRMP